MANPPNFIDLQRSQRLAVNSRLSFNSVVNNGAPASQSIAEPVPTATPTPAPTPTPTPAPLAAYSIVGTFNFNESPSRYGCFDGTYTLSGNNILGGPVYRLNNNFGQHVFGYTTYFDTNRFVLSINNESPDYTYRAATTSSNIYFAPTGRYTNVTGVIQDAVVQQGSLAYAYALSTNEAGVLDGVYTRYVSAGTAPSTVYQYRKPNSVIGGPIDFVYDYTTSTWILSNAIAGLMFSNILTGGDYYTGETAGYNRFTPPVSGTYISADQTTYTVIVLSGSPTNPFK
jgi:hypothetical protein